MATRALTEDEVRAALHAGGYIEGRTARNGTWRRALYTAAGERVGAVPAFMFDAVRLSPPLTSELLEASVTPEGVRFVTRARHRIRTTTEG